MNYGYTPKSVPLVITSVIVGVLLTLSSMAVRPVSAAGFASVPPGNWVGSDGNDPYNWSYANQTQIGPNNVNQLQVSWVYPTAPTPSQYLAYTKFTTVPIGITSTGTLVNGIFYALAQYSQITATNAKTGALIWQQQLNLKYNCMQNMIPVNGANLTGHYHNIWYTPGIKGVWANEPLIWVMSANHTAFAFDALTGVMKVHFQTYNPCATYPGGATGVPGNFGLYDTTTQNAAFDLQRGILVTGSSVSESVTAGRGFFVGFDISVNPPKQIWGPVYSMPPQDGSQANWSVSSIQNMTHAWALDPQKGACVNKLGFGSSTTMITCNTPSSYVDLKSLSAAQYAATIAGDWGNMGYNGTRSNTGSGTGWGGNWALDPATGNAFVGTSNPSPYNGTFRPGPDLWAESVLSINDQTGKINWAVATAPHDNLDVDCNWSRMMINSTIGGSLQKTFVGTCKGGQVFNLNADTGQPNWYEIPPSIAYCKTCGILDILNATQMKQDNWYSWPHNSYASIQANNGKLVYDTENPNGGSGVESNSAFDPTTGLLYVQTFNRPSNGTGTADQAPTKGLDWTHPATNTKSAPLSTKQCGTVSTCINATIWAIDVNTGAPAWHRFIPLLGFRGGSSATNGMLIVPLDNGSLLFLNDKNGALLRNMFIGSAMVTQPTIGKDVSGNTQIILPAEIPISAGVYVGTGRTTSTPGFLFSVSLGPGPSTSTVTSVATSTVAGPTVTSTSVSTVQGPGSTTTSTSTTVSTTTATVVSTAAGGGSNTVTYGLAGALAVFVIATGYLVLRGKKPAS